MRPTNWRRFCGAPVASPINVHSNRQSNEDAVHTACSLDGFLADEQNKLDWLFQFGDGPDGDYPEFIKNVGALATGSTTYDCCSIT